jgi:hypothetical protein
MQVGRKIIFVFEADVNKQKQHESVILGYILRFIARSNYIESQT